MLRLFTVFINIIQYTIYPSVYQIKTHLFADDVHFCPSPVLAGFRNQCSVPSGHQMAASASKVPLPHMGSSTTSTWWCDHWTKGAIGGSAFVAGNTCIYVCVCLAISAVCILCMYIYVCVSQYVMYVCMHACMYACMHVCMYACMHVCMYACMHVCMYVCMYACMYACMHLCIYRSIDL